MSDALLRQFAGMSLIACLFATLYLAESSDTPLSVLGRFDLTCVICKQRFTALACSQSNTRGGVDRDLFARALGPQPEFYRIATCPRCGYSGYPADFDPQVPVPPDVRDKILVSPKLHLPAGFTPESDPRELDARDRHALAINCYQWRQKSDEALAWLHLRASWIAREEGSSLPQDKRLARVLAFAERWRPEMQSADNQLDVEMQLATRMAEAVVTGQFNRFQQPYMELALALILRRHGENRCSEPLLERLIREKSFSADLRESTKSMLQSIHEEKRRQVQAADYFERALLAEQIAPANRGAAYYLLGELCRRLGRDEQAIAWFEKALSDEAIPQDLHTWAIEQRTCCLPMHRDERRPTK